MNDVVVDTTARAEKVDGFGNGSSRALPAKLWAKLDRVSQAVLLVAALIAVMGAMLATAGSAYAGTCTGTTDIASMDIKSLMPVLI